MKKSFVVVIFVCVVFFGGCSTTPGSAVNTNSQPVATNRIEGLLAAGKTKIREGKYETAVNIFSTIAETSGTDRAEALFYKGEALLELHRHEDALECFNKVLGLNPNVNLLRKTLNRKYRIGIDYLLGNAESSFIGLFSYSSPGFGVQILDQLVRDYPFESFSDEALYSMANYYFRDEQWEEAQPVYERLIESYPTSEWVPPAYFQLGKVIYNTIKGYKYDPTPVMKSMWYFKRFLQQRQVGPEAQEARKYIRKLQDMEARYELYVGQFYLRDDNIRGARLRFEAALKKGKEKNGELTDAAKAARKILLTLPQTKDKT